MYDWRLVVKSITECTLIRKRRCAFEVCMATSFVYNPHRTLSLSKSHAIFTILANHQQSLFGIDKYQDSSTIQLKIVIGTFISSVLRIYASLYAHLDCAWQQALFIISTGLDHHLQHTQYVNTN